MLSCSRSRRSSQARCPEPARSAAASSARARNEAAWRSPDALAVAASREHLRRVLGDRVEHHEAALIALDDPDQALVGEQGQPVENVDTELVGRSADALGGAEVEPALEDRQAVQEKTPGSSRRS